MLFRFAKSQLEEDCSGNLVLNGVVEREQGNKKLQQLQMVFFPCLLGAHEAQNAQEEMI